MHSLPLAHTLVYIRLVPRNRLRIPFFGSLVKAGFPSPASDYIERVCDLNDLCIHNAEATYFVRVDGDSMIDEHIMPGDIMVVDCSLETVNGRIVVAWYNGAHTVKRLRTAPPLIVLEPANEKYEPIYIQPGDDFKLFGVVTFVIHKTT
ncbi:LexA family protein [Fibrella aestuarina]|uniref:LexA family protein n=1 Tax=Fibrella aestuarina TaxID=651143 RepID=UPI0002ECB29F|nr:translesion error-prone DNA polymerase V autoproteolytic subunit [Fibrella aestuarina]